MRLGTATLFSALLLCSCGVSIHRITTANGVQVGTVDPNDHSTTTPNPSIATQCQLARGVKDGKSVLEFDFGADVATGTLTIGTSDGSYISLGYDFSAGDERNQTMGLTVSRDSITINDGITITGSGTFDRVFVKLEVVLTDGSHPADPCQLNISPQ